MKILFVFCFLCISLTGSAHEWNANSKENSLTNSIVFDAQGKLWRVFEKNGLVLVDSSQDLGKTFSNSVQVSVSAQKIASDSEVRPKIAIGREGNIYLTWTEMLKKPFIVNVWFSRSTTGGKSFEKPIIIRSDLSAITDSFDAINVSASGKVTVTWIDKSALITPKAAGNSYESTAIYYVVSNNQGDSFLPKQKLADNICNFSSIALINKPDGAIVAMWLNEFEGGERDHLIAEIPSEMNQIPEPRRATFGRMKIDGCLHQCVALAVGGEGKDWWGYHMAWFDGGKTDSDQDATLFYARMDGEAWVSSPPKKFGKHINQAGHPALLSMDEKVWLVWLEVEIKNNVKQNTIFGMYSDDGGRSWGEAKILASVAGRADYPSLLANGNQAYLVWDTEKEGLTLNAL
jgi:hypothetical protein